jgi:hypothetical protein
MERVPGCDDARSSPPPEADSSPARAPPVGSRRDLRGHASRAILSDEQKMLERVLREIPKLTDAVVGADVKAS